MEQVSKVSDKTSGISDGKNRVETRCSQCIRTFLTHFDVQLGKNECDVKAKATVKLASGSCW